ncbi:adenylate/guanylate cyclase domain-containing protein [Roseibium denhamense]|uniref:Adenylate cyclase, class 3 n=1 Tax=Roseibium denhamense TaxID=76305 RepID=A0ABY1N697_9HYPH|nr:adenylate/guanylate cyclase domain-containing protein [Roseibium denhamense]MTI06067.1 adenylate/guanylate cyclase domain-containing protein [Roseibium denhamense]SMP01551.1 Adenylate cyclase, class 3 [Roseibium denhamense]
MPEVTQFEADASRSRRDDTNDHELSRLETAERAGLKLAILCRTAVIGVTAAYWITANFLIGAAVSSAAAGILTGLTLYGVATYFLIGTRLDRWWLKYTIYTIDILAVCAAFALVPLRQGQDIPQIMAFRAYGIHLLFPLIAMACLSLSWRLVLWSGCVAVFGWFTAYWWVLQDMPRRLEWRDFPDNPTTADYETLFLSVEFAGTGNRVGEAGMAFLASAILALAVYRARQVFFSQLRAEQARQDEQAARERATSILGKYVPEAVALRLVNDTQAMGPQGVHGVVLIADIAGFSDYAAGKPPTEVISRLNRFLDLAASSVSACNGVVILFTGDGLLATFNTPISIDEPETAALQCARDLVGHARAEGFSLRVGLAGGPLAAGSVGSSDRQAFTVYGETVNRAARLEALGKTLGASIIADEAVMNKATAPELEAAGSHPLKGLPGSWPVWALRNAERR